MTLFRPLLVLLLLVFPGASTSAETLPGFRVETLASLDGFVSSVVTDSQGTVYATTTNGWIFRIEGSQAVRVVSLPTRAGGNGGLLGMALLDDTTAVVHYTHWSGDQVLDDVISRVDLSTGAEEVLKAFVCDIEYRERGVSDEHHGGNPIVGPDGAIFVGIGEFGGRTMAQKPEWNGGKIWRIDSTTGAARQWSMGVRNPYDLAWDPELERIVIADNGPSQGDELHIVQEGENCGWPVTFGHEAPVSGMAAPAYVFQETIAPTGLHRLRGANALLPRGYLLGSFVTRGLYYFPDLTKRPIADPVPLIDLFSQYIIDVTEGPDGSIYLATATFAGSAIHRLHVPPRGDCNGDGLADWQDVYPLLQEIGDGGSHPAIQAQDGTHHGAWGCDANADGLIDSDDLAALVTLIGPKRRTVRAR